MTGMPISRSTSSGETAAGIRRAARDEIMTDGDSSLQDRIVMLAEIANFIHTDDLDVGDKVRHAVAFHKTPNVRHIAGQRNRESEALAKRTGKMTGSTQ